MRNLRFKSCSQSDPSYESNQIKGTKRKYIYVGFKDDEIRYVGNSNLQKIVK